MEALQKSLARTFGSLSLNASMSRCTALSAPSTQRNLSTSAISRVGSGSSMLRTPKRPSSPIMSMQTNRQQQTRHRSVLAPKQVKYKKAHRGSVPVPTGGSIKGTTLEHGVFGIRALDPTRLSAKQLAAAETAIKRKLKVVKGAQVFLRLFPDIPVCVKGNTRMGKGKGSFEFWACRATVGKVIFEVGGFVEIRPEVAKEALRLGAAKLPIRTEFVTRASPPRLGNLVLSDLAPDSTGGVTASDNSQIGRGPSVEVPASAA